jgi:hypothetical protein
MAEIRLKLDEVTLCIKDAQIILHGIRRERTGAVADHVDITLPWSVQRFLPHAVNLDGIDYRSLDER